MPDYPNVVDMIFGRIDRNTDTRYRDRALAQNNNLALIQNQRDIDRINLERARQAEAAKQWAEGFGLTKTQDERAAAQQRLTNEMALTEGVAKGMLRPVSSQQEMGIKPDNIFMQNPSAVPGVTPPDPRMGLGVTFGGKTYQPINQFEQQRSQTNLLHQDETARKNQEINDYVDMQVKMGIPQAIAVINARSPQLGAQIAGDGRNLASYLTMLGSNHPGAARIAKDVMANWIKMQQASSSNPAMDAAHYAQANNANTQARLHSMQIDQMKMDPLATQLAAEAFQVAGQKHKPGTPEFYTEVNNYISSKQVDVVTKSSAWQKATKELTDKFGKMDPLTAAMERGKVSNPTVPQATVTATQPPSPANRIAPNTPITPEALTRPNNWNGRAVQPFTPTPATNGQDTSRPSGSGPAQVNNKPASITGPVNGALRYTQPNQQTAAPIAMPQPNSQGLVPVYRSDGSIDGHVTPERWQEMNTPTPPMEFSNPFIGLSQWVLERQRRQAAERQRPYNFNNQSGFGYRPQNY